ncbi:hypothetical protein ABZP36_005160 [Zizania latifolia]
MPSPPAPPPRPTVAPAPLVRVQSMDGIVEKPASQPGSGDGIRREIIRNKGEGRRATQHIMERVGTRKESRQKLGEPLTNAEPSRHGVEPRSDASGEASEQDESRAPAHHLARTPPAAPAPRRPRAAATRTRAGTTRSAASVDAPPRPDGTVSIRPCAAGGSRERGKYLVSSATSSDICSCDTCYNSLTP